MVPEISNKQYSLYLSSDYGGWISPDNKLYTFDGNHHYDFLANFLGLEVYDSEIRDALRNGWVRLTFPNRGSDEFSADAFTKERLSEALGLLSEYILLRAENVTISWGTGKWAMFLLPRDKNKFLYFIETGDVIEENLSFVRTIIREEVEKFFS
jgi:hypothetical protein